MTESGAKILSNMKQIKIKTTRVHHGYTTLYYTQQQGNSKTQNYPRMELENGFNITL